MIYLYGFGDARSPDAPELGTGVAGEPLRPRPCGELVAIVGELPSTPPVNAETLAAHDAAVRRAAGGAPAFLPARFGQAFATEAALAQAIAAEGERLERALALVRGCAQMTLRLFLSMAGAGEQAAASEPPSNAGDRESEAVSAGPGARFLAARRAATVAAASLPELEPVRRALLPFIRAERVRRSAVPGFVGTAYHLVATADIAGYLAVVRSHTVGRGQRLAVSGPWPAYAFAPELAS